MDAPTSIFSVDGYQVQTKIGQGSMGEVYRATNRLTGQSIALKRVRLPASSDQVEPASAAHELALMSEFKLVAALHHPHLVTMLDYGFDKQHQPFLAMELLDQPCTVIHACADLADAGKVQFLIEILQTMAYVHQHGIVHRDLKPSNVLVANGQLKIVDFGVAIDNDRSHNLAGTLAYMAPEVLLGMPMSQASDLYAVGVIAYEMFYGRYPFDTSSEQAMLAAILGPNRVRELGDAGANDVTLTEDEATVGPAQALEIIEGRQSLDAPGPFGPIIQKLLLRNPRDRYPHARAVIADIRAAGGRVAKEEAHTRDSFLRTAKLVGRDQEIESLSRSLTATIAGEGSAWLIGGESGIGKSRLLDELRTLALVQGASVVRAHTAVDSGGPYQQWRSALRSLSLQTTIADDDLAILGTLIPDLSELTQRPIPALADMPPQAAQAHLFGAIENIFRRQQRPLLLILEDLHWAGADSIALLKHLTPILATLPVMLVASYRNDERPTLPEELPQMHALTLSRLSGENVAQLSESMLGPDGRASSLVQFLEKESEGNVFFLIEIVRALAEQAGSLDAISSKHLPQHILTGGIRQIVEHRLAQVTAHDRELLSVAALCGRSLSLPLLTKLLDGIDLRNWLITCANASILTMQQGEWSFAHDKLRETILSELSPVTTKQWHRHIAEALEEETGGGAITNAASLAYHWQQAGDPAKAAGYFRQAGDLAMRLYAHIDARRHYGNAIEELDKLSAASLATPETLQQRIDTLLLLTNVSWALGDPGQVFARLQQSEEDLSQSPVALSRDDTLRLARVRFNLGRINYVRNARGAAIAIYRKVIEAAEALGDQELLATAASYSGIAMFVQGHFGKCAVDFAQAVTLLEKLGNWMEWMRVQGFFGMSKMVRGEREEGMACLDSQVNKATALNSENQSLSVTAALSYKALGMLLGGSALADARVAAEALMKAAELPGGDVYRFIGHGLLSWIDCRTGDLDSARAHSEAAQAIRAALGGKKILLGEWVAAFNLDILVATGRGAEAIAEAEKLIAIAQQDGDIFAEGMSQQAWGRALFATAPERWSEISTHMNESARILDSGDCRMEIARLELDWAEMEKAHGDKERAGALEARAKAQFARAGLPCPEPSVRASPPRPR